MTTIKEAAPAKTISGNAIDVLMLLGITYIVAKAFTPTAQNKTQTVVEIFLGLSFISASFLRKHLFGINRKGLPRLEDLECESMANEWCRQTCMTLRESLADLEHSGALRSRKGVSWRLGGYGAGIGGILLALLTSSGVVAAVGVLLCLPSVLDWLKDNPQYWAHWQHRVESLRDLLSRFSKQCLEDQFAGTAQQVLQSNAPASGGP